MDAQTTDQNIGTPAPGTGTPEVPDTPVQTPVQSPDPNTPDTGTPDPNPADKPSENTNTFTEDILLSGLKFEGQDVNVNIPADLANAASEKGIDIQAVTKELYSESGLSQETRNALDTAFGKWQVDAYLKGLDAINRGNMTRFKTDSENSAKAAETAWNETLTIMGGEDRWSDMDSWAVQNLSEEDLSEFNKVMKEGTVKMQKLMIKDLWGQFESAGKPNAPVHLDLEQGDNIPANDTGSAITQAEFFQAFQSGEYRKDPTSWDARRKAGISKGI